MRNRPREVDEGNDDRRRYQDYPTYEGFPKTTWEKFKQLFDSNKD